MKKILFATNFASPYRVDFFNFLGKSCDLTVAYERRKALHRDAGWVGNQACFYQEIYLKTKPVGTSRSRGRALVKLLEAETYDFIIFSGYASPTIRRAIVYCRLRKIPYYIEYDGGFNKKEPFYKTIVKRYLVKNAQGHFITCQEFEKYLLRLGVPQERLIMYPFSSLNQRDILAVSLTYEEKKRRKADLNISAEYAILSVGRFIYSKGFDFLMKAFAQMKNRCVLYIVGGQPTEEYIQIKNELGLDHVHFVDFMSKEELKRWYQACDLFVLPTRQDVWGLVINEAMSNGLPVISTQRCIAALELVENGINGYVVPVDDVDSLALRMDELAGDSKKCKMMGDASLRKIREYTIENMAETHKSALMLD